MATMFRCRRATAIETIMLCSHTAFPNLEDLFSDVFGSNVSEIIISDPYLYTDIQQFCLYRWLCFIRDICRAGPVETLRRLKIRIVTKEMEALRQYRTVYQQIPDGTIQTVLQNIFDSVEFDDEVKLSPILHEQIHDRAISILSSSATGSSFYHVKLGRGLAMVNCECQICYYYRTRFNRRFKQHALVGMDTTNLRTQQCEVSKIKWSQAQDFHVQDLFEAYCNYIENGIITALVPFNN